MADVILPPISITAAAPGYSDVSNGQPFPSPAPVYIYNAQQQERNSYYAQGLWREMILKMMHEQYFYLRNGVISGLVDAVARDPQTLAYADSYLAQNPSLSPTQALNYTYKQIITDHKVMPTPTKLSGSLLTPVAALGHFLYGKGTQMVADLQSISLQPSSTPIPRLEAAFAQAPVGISTISLDKVNYDTAKDSWITGSWLGNITLKIDGSLVKGADGTINFNGSARAYNDIYDANPGTWRNWMDEKATTALAAIQKYVGATPYEIQLQGAMNINIYRY